MDAALHVGFCECTDNSRKGALKECCAHVLIIWRCTSILLTLCDKGQLPMEANELGKDSCRNLWDHFAKQKGNKQKKKASQLPIYNLQPNTNKLQAQRQLDACLFWHRTSGIFPVHSKHPAQCSAVIYTHLCIGRTALSAAVL